MHSNTRKTISDPMFRRKTGMLNGLTALGATMIAVTLTSPIPSFWKGLMTGLWIAGTIGLIGWQVTFQRHYHSHEID
ncbi:hypothetical protein [Sulfobacillus thermosulfidooxidans]|uniref:hypothetical protein n=1 Tax=Sulfobacillus thermosulfidooxidans TaxID=28034 RepID=UPI0003772D01|nr:hypothetical protein [Sulfobacillus thermosulfidooxidans]